MASIKGKYEPIPTGCLDIEGNQQHHATPAASNKDKATASVARPGVWLALGSAALLLVLLLVSGPRVPIVSMEMGGAPSMETGTGHHLVTKADARDLFDWAGRYILKNFDSASPMANFLPGLGGYWGVPMWAFYVNRGQAMSSIGVANKDGSIAMYNTAEKVYQQVVFDGFRTFLRGTKGKTSFSTMPFFCHAQAPGQAGAGQVGPGKVRNMAVGMNSVEITEIDSSLNLNTTVTYFTITDEDFPAMVINKYCFSYFTYCYCVLCSI
jgi:hypothetical protein